MCIEIIQCLNYNRYTDSINQCVVNRTEMTSDIGILFTSAKPGMSAMRSSLSSIANEPQKMASIQNYWLKC